MTRAADRPIRDSDACRNAVRLRSDASGSVTERSSSPGPSTVVPGPVMKLVTGTSRTPPPGDHTVAVASRDAAREVIAPAGRARQRLPPTVAMFCTLNEASRAWQHWRSSGTAAQAAGPGRGLAGRQRASSVIVQVAAISRPPGCSVSGAQPKPRRSSSRRRPGCGSEKSQVPPASQASPGCQTAPGAGR